MTPELSSLQHPLVKHLAKLRKNRQYRFTCGTALICGHHLVNELCPAIPTKRILLCDETVLHPNVLPEEHYLVSENVMKKITGQPQPEGIAAEIALPPPHSLSKKGRWIALDQVSDPGNVGTLLRTALALGWEGAFLINGSADPFHERAIRAAMGASFRLPLQFGTASELVNEAKEHTLLLAHQGGEAIETISLSDRLVLALGNETRGASRETRGAAGAEVAIPMAGEMESLNVAAAGAIAMYEVMRRS